MIKPTPGSRGARIRLNALSKQYAPHLPPAVDAIDMEMLPGEFLTLLGPSGSGKTTTLNMIAGFLDPTGGTIELNGEDISTTPPHKRDFGMVFQNYALFPHLTVDDNVAFPLKQRRIAKGERARLVREALELVDLGDKGGRMPSELSGGQQQRVALARAVVYSPRLLLLDEPLGALDRRLRQSLQGEIKRIHRELGLTFVFVTHDQDEAMSLSDRIAVFNDGHIERLGTPVDLYDDPGTLFVAEFLGESNLFMGEKVGAEYTWAGSPLRLGDARPVSDDDVLVVRPEKVCVTADGSQVPEDANVTKATVVDFSYLGTVRRVDLEYPDGRRGVAVLSGSAEDHHEPGSSVYVHWRTCHQVFVQRVADRGVTSGSVTGSKAPALA